MARKEQLDSDKFKDEKLTLNLFSRIPSFLKTHEPALPMRSGKRLDAWEPAQVRLAREVAEVVMSLLQHQQRFAGINRELWMNLATSAFERWRNNVTGLNEGVVSVDSFITEVNNYLTNPNELPALAATVGALNSFVGLGNRDTLQAWLIRQFPVLHSTGTSIS